MKERCLTLLENARKQNYKKENILDTSKLSIEDTVQIILNNDRFII